MGAYGTVLTPVQRWQVIHYVYSMTKPAETAAAPAATSTSSN
jgi:hypothetical protein